MKRVLVTLAVVLSFISFSSFKTNDDSIAPAALKSFRNSFKTATEVSWTVAPNFYKANFNLNGQFVTAYYNAEGAMMALTRNISSTELPIALQARLKAKYDGYWISDLFELANEEGTAYYITVENADAKLVLRSSSSLDWSVYKKQRKS